MHFQRPVFPTYIYHSSPVANFTLWLLKLYWKAIFSSSTTSTDFFQDKFSTNQPTNYDSTILEWAGENTGAGTAV